MSKFELSIASDYVSDWTYEEAVREIFQNALDAGDYEWSYDSDTQILSISNGGARLEPKTLLLGCSSKAGDPNTIGQFGEGYKIALLVLTREGKQVKIYNGKSREVWLARLVKSRRYGADVLTIFTEKLSFWEKPEDKVTFEIEGILEEEFNRISDHNLHICEPVGEVHETDRGQILLDEQYEGQVYVNGLYVCDYDELHYGYNFKPQYLRLDRDRKTVRGFDVKWESSAMWTQVGGSECTKLCFEGAPDVAFVHAQYSSRGVHDVILDAFKDKYGTNAVPCRNQEEIEVASARYTACKPVVVSDTVYSMIHDKVVASIPKAEMELTLRERFEKWYAEHVVQVTTEGEALWEELLDELN